MELPDLLDKCADDVSRDGGWRQHDFGDYRDPDAPVCSIGAVMRYAGYQTLPAELAIEETLGEGFGIAEWNDNRNRTAGEVADMFRSTAKRIRENGNG